MTRPTPSGYSFGKWTFKIFFTLILFQSSLSWAQIQSVPGYVVTNNRDTLRGFIENRSKKSDYKVCYFRKGIKEKSTAYTPNDIIAFGLTNLKYYETITVKDKLGKDQLAFAGILLPGRASLFRYGEEMYLRHDSLGIYNLHFNTIRDLTGMNKVRGKLNFIFSDCKKGKRIAWDSIILTDEKITELVKNYNICKNSQGKLNPTSKIPALKGNLGILAGIDITNMQFQPFSSTAGTIALQATKFESSSSPIFGLSYGLSFPRFNSNFSLYAEASYFKSVIRGHGSAQGISVPETEDITLSANYLKIGLGVRIQFPTRNFTPFLKFGISSYNDSNFSGVRTRTQYINNIPVTEVTNPWTSGSQSGLWLSGGVQRKISGKVSISLEARYDRTNGFNGPYPAYPLSGSHTTFLFGIGF
jgi:hypothetical protein